MSASSPTKLPPSILTRSNSSQKKVQQLRNFSNPSYHSSLDLAKAYSGMVNSHLLTSAQRNHALSSAQRTYKRQILIDKLEKSDKKMIRSKSSYMNGEKKNVIKTVNFKNNKVARNPEDQQTSKSVVIGGQQNNIMDEKERMRVTQLRQVLSRKTYRVPEYSQQLQMLCQQKQSLQKLIKQLKLKITQQAKLKSKLSLSCAKTMNNRQLTHKNYCTTYQQNYHLNTSILQTQKQNNILQQQIQKLKQKNNQTINNINEQKKQCEILKKYVDQTKRVLMNQQKDVSKLKSMVTISFNNMSNNYMNMNLLLSEKALLLGDIDLQHGKNK